MQKNLKLFFLILLASCASKVPEQKKVLELPKLEVKKIKVYNGKIKFYNFKTQLANGIYNMNCVDLKKTADTAKQKFQVEQGRVRLYFLEDYYSESKSKKCFLDDKRLFLKVDVVQFPYKEEVLRVPKRKVELSEADQKRVEREFLEVREIYKDSADQFLFDSPFRLPLNSKITSHFGKRRLFNNKKKSAHTGVDFRARVGVKIPVANTGRVVYSGNLFYTGNVVIVDHGMDIFSLYAHLSRIDVKEGQLVQKGDIVGLAGKTGRVSGPHLHWGIKFAGRSADGITLMRESKKHFNSKNL